MEVTAKLKYLRIAPRKVRLVADLIRGKGVSKAEEALRFLPKRAAKPILKLLQSGVANAAHNFNLKKDGLRIVKIIVDEGPSFKRIRPRAFGKAFPVRKRTSHVTLMLSDSGGGGAFPKTARKKKGGPIIATEPREYETHLAEKPSAKADAKAKFTPKKRGPDIIRRVFQRKAI